jgi:uncharacterized membrane protein
VSDGAAFQAGEVIGQIFVIALLIGGGIWLGERLGRRKDPPRRVWWPGIVSVVLVLFYLVGRSEPEAGDASTGVETRP